MGHGALGNLRRGKGEPLRWCVRALVRQRGLLPHREALRQGEAVRWAASRSCCICRGFPHERLPKGFPGSHASAVGCADSHACGVKGVKGKKEERRNISSPASPAPPASPASPASPAPLLHPGGILT